MMQGINDYAGAFSYGASYGILGAAGATQTSDGISKNPGASDVKNVGRASSPADCQTCKERKNQDGSDEKVSL